MKKSRAGWYAAAVAIPLFFALSFVTDRIQDALFFSHTSIQNGITECQGAGAFSECWSEDGERAYNSWMWALAGNGVALLLTLVRITLAIFAATLVMRRLKTVD